MTLLSYINALQKELSMKKLLNVLIVVGLLLVSAYVYTQTVEVQAVKPWSNPVPWRADPGNPTPGNDTVTIQSGSGIHTEVQISVDHNSTGANLTNCGGTTHLSPGSSAICVTDSPTKPITIASDNLSRPAVGTYQIRTP